MIRKVLIWGCVMLLAVSVTGCETPSQSATKRPDTMGSATAMLTGHRPAKKKKTDDTKKMIALYGSITAMGGIYYYYETKRKRA